MQQDVVSLCPKCGAYWEGCECHPEVEPGEEMTPEEIDFWLELNAEAIKERENLT